MEKVIETFNEMKLKVQKLYEAMVITSHKPEIISELSELSKASKEVKFLESDIKTLLKNHEEGLKKEYAKTTKTIQMSQMKMMYLLQHLEYKNKQEQGVSTFAASLNYDSLSTPNTRGSKEDLNEGNVLNSVKPNSALTVTKETEFVADISNEVFAKVPDYMKGRTTRLDLQVYLNVMIIRAFKEKYSILSKQRSTLNTSELKNYNMFKDQARLFSDSEKFITVGDIERVAEKKVDKKDDRFIQMLRHLQIIREARKNSICCYIWLR